MIKLYKKVKINGNETNKIENIPMLNFKMFKIVNWIIELLQKKYLKLELL